MSTFRHACLVLLFAASASAQDRDHEGALGAPPSTTGTTSTTSTTSTTGTTGTTSTGTTGKIAVATDVPFSPQPGTKLVKFNLQDADLAELVNQVSGLTGKRFIFGEKIRQIKATVVSPEPVTLDEAYQAFLSILDANGMTVVPHGRFLKIIDSGGVVAQPTPLLMPGESVPDSDRFVTRLYRLQHVSGEEAAALLSKFKSKDGDISVFGPGKLVIITDTATQVRRLMRIVEEIDVGGSGQHLWIEAVHNGSALELAKQLNDLFDLGAGGAAGAGPSGAARSGGLSKVIADEQMNSLIIVGTEESYLRLLELLKRLDSQAAETGKIHVLPLQHAIADEMSQTLNQMLGGANAAGRGAAGPVESGAGGAFEGELRVTADKSTNSLIITSSNRDYAALRLVVEKLDHARRQVFIEAVIMDLSVSDSTTIGMSFHGGSMLGAQQDSLLLAGFQASNSVGFPADASLLQGFAAGIRGPALANTTNILGTGLSIPEFGVVLNAVASSGRSNILATPHIIATDNVAAEISVGENIPLQTNVGSGLSALSNASATGATAASQLSSLGGSGAAPRQDVGNKIKITPHVNESNQVRLEIDQESSAQGATSGTLGVVSITKRTANTTVIVQDQQTVVIGGLMSDSYVTTRTKVPVLGDLPLLGALFRTSDVQKTKKNLLLVLTPYVIRDQEDLRKIFEQKMQERQEFLDRYLVFSGDDWKPPHDWSRTNGLLEDIRKSFAEIAEQERVEQESRRQEIPPRTPSVPIELPDDNAIGASAPAAPGHTPGR